MNSWANVFKASGNIHNVNVLFCQIEMEGQIDACSDNFQQCHQKHQPILEVVPENVPQVHLRNIAESLNRKQTQVVNNYLHFLYVGLDYGIAVTIKAWKVGHGQILALVLERDEGGH